MTVKDIHINQLQVGMYICEIDLPWIKNPFFRQKLLIKSKSQINELKSAGCKSLKIDTSQGADITENAPLEGRQKQPPPTVEKKTASQEKHSDEATSQPDDSDEPKLVLQAASTEKKPLIKRPQAPSKSVEDFFNKQQAALAIRNQTLDAIQEINSQISKGNPIQQEKILPLVDTLIEELNENEQAILATLNIKSSHGFLNAHLYNTMALALSASTNVTHDVNELMIIGQAALLHDIGWAKLPGYLIQKGRQFTPQEQKLTRQHVDLALAQLKSFPDIPPRVIELVANHHEQPNGQGYPGTVKGENLDQASRLLAIVVKYDEMTHALFDNLGMLPAKAMKQLFKEAHQGILDSKLVAGFIHLLGVYPIGSAVLLSDKSKGVIVHHQPDSPLKPQVMLYYDGNGAALPSPALVDTKNIEGLEIAGFIDTDNPEEDPQSLLGIQTGSH